MPEWRPVPGYPGFFASDAGVLVGPSGRSLRPMVNDEGYLYVEAKGCRPRKLRVNRAVLLAFVGQPPRGHEGRHVNGNRTDNRLSNLLWGTPKQNARDKRMHGTMACGERNGAAKLSDGQLKELLEMKPRPSLRALGKRYHVSHETIRQALERGRWSEL